MDNTLLEFEESLEALEKERESLELAMREMGAECKESEINHGWLTNFSLNLNSTTQETNKHYTTTLFHLIQPNAGPSHDYLQTLLNVNQEILAQSLAASSKANDTHDNSPEFFVTQPDPLTSHETLKPTHLLTPPITPPEE
ncbi:hypothetical protein A0J61_00097 [Choanephora cucurbitarum]|uniref:Uncharacterized protein n=1 Tax=Choanephora cucurbitarum TaxID=101091 RepID=A0A1C7NT35_9FUNG|nr:hypothetical protein A0J61_00097 [Choanephora cucurbitarum]